MNNRGSELYDRTIESGGVVDNKAISLDTLSNACLSRLHWPFEGDEKKGSSLDDLWNSVIYANAKNEMKRNETIRRAKGDQEMQRAYDRRWRMAMEQDSDNIWG